MERGTLPFICKWSTTIVGPCHVTPSMQPWLSPRHLTVNNLRIESNTTITQPFLSSHVNAPPVARPHRYSEPQTMADPETPSRTKSKRKRWTALSDPEEIRAEIMNELQSSRDGIDKKLAKFNHSFMETQSKKRRLFIESYSTRLSSLPDDVRHIVAARLLSNEDFNVEMDYSEVHTSNANSLLTWSCTDASLSDPSWRACESLKCGHNADVTFGTHQPLTTDFHDPVLQKIAEGAAASSSPRAGTLARTTRATSKGSSSRAQSSTPIAELPGHPNPTKVPDSGMARGLLSEYAEGDEDLLSASQVTIPRPRKARKKGILIAPLSNDSSPRGKVQDPATKKTSSKKTPPHGRFWSQQECITLRDFCYKNDEAFSHEMSPFWQNMSVHLPGRTARACYMKWRDLRHRGEPRQHEKIGGPGKRPLWSSEELKKLAQCRPQPGESCDWAQVATHFPGRTARACFMQYKNIASRDLEAPSGLQSRGRQILGAEGNNGEREQGNINMMTREGEGDMRKSPDGEDLEVL